MTTGGHLVLVLVDEGGRLGLVFALRLAVGATVAGFNERDGEFLCRISALRRSYGTLEAIEQRQLVLYYQPTIDCSRRQIKGVEALVRWHHPTRGLIPPDRPATVARG